MNIHQSLLSHHFARINILPAKINIFNWPECICSKIDLLQRHTIGSRTTGKDNLVTYASLVKIEAG